MDTTLKQQRYSDEEYYRMRMSCAGDPTQMYVIHRHQDVFGKEVEVIKGRKVPIGTKGKVIWFGSRIYGGWRISISIGIETEEGETVFTNIDNIKVID